MATPIAVYSQYPGGNKAALNVTAAGTIVKPSPGCLYRVSVQVAGTTSGALTVNDSNAYVTAQTITGISVAAQAVVTLSTGGSTNPFAIGNTINVSSAVGMTQINGVQGQVVAIGGVTTAWTVTTNINSSLFTAWSSGGSAASFNASNVVYTVPYNGTAYVAGLVVTLDWPCLQGILVSAVPSAGTPILALTYL